MTGDALADTKATSREDAPRRRSTKPSTSEAEAKNRFVSALSNGVNTLLDRGRGRDRASTALLNEIADGCSPDEAEIFQAMESFGIGFDDATKVVTVSTAFREARAAGGGSAIAAVDELTSRLNAAAISRTGSSRSPSPAPSVASSRSTPGSAKKLTVAKRESADASKTRPAVATKSQRSTSSKSHQHRQGRGRKRALADMTPENFDANAMSEEPQNKAAAAVDFQVKGKLAKLSKEERKKPKSAAEGAGLRGKRTTAPRVEEVHANKRARTRAEGSILTV